MALKRSMMFHWSFQFRGFSFWRKCVFLSELCSRYVFISCVASAEWPHCPLPRVVDVSTHPSLSFICSLPRPSNPTHLVFLFSYRTHLCHTVISVTWSRRSQPLIGFSLVQAILLGLGLQHKTINELEVSISSAQADRTFRPHFTTLKAGLHVRRQNEWEPGSESATQRHLGSFEGTGRAKIPSKHFAPIHLWLFVQPGTQQLHCRGIFTCLFDWLTESCPSKQSQAPLQ